MLYLKMPPAKPDNLKMQAVHGTFWFGISRIAIQLLGWIATIAVARILTPSDYGLLGFATLVSGLAILLNELGLGAAIVQSKDLTEAELETVFWMGLCVSLLVYAVTFISAPWIASFFHEESLALIIRIDFLEFIIGAFRIISWNQLTKRLDFKRRSGVEVIATVCYLITVVFLAFSGAGVWSFIFAGLIRQLVLTVGCQWLVPWWPLGRFEYRCIRRVFSYGVNLSFGRILWYLYSNADFFVVGKLLGKEALGFYTMVWQLCTAPVDKISSVINGVAFPVYTQLQDQPKRLTRYFLKITMLISAVTLPLLAGVFLVADLAIPLLLTAKWQPIVHPIQIMCWVGVIMSLSVLIGPLVNAIGRVDLPWKFNALCLLVMPAGFAVGTRYGLWGVCIAWFVLFPILVAVWYGVTRKLVGYEWKGLFSSLRPAVICTFILLLSELALRWSTVALPLLARLITVIISGVAIYLAAFYGLFRSEFVEIRSLLNARNRSLAT